MKFVFPRFCLGCGNFNETICDKCTSGLTVLEKQQCPECGKENLDGRFCGERCAKGFYFDRLLVASDYSDHTLRELISRFKYSFSKELVEILGKLLEKAYKNCIEEKSLISFVPLHPKRERWRGFNQSQLLAEKLGEDLNLPVLSILRRRVYSAPQVSLTRKKRLNNLKGAFEVDTKLLSKCGQQLEGSSIVLVDDVSTTGTTINECVRVLKEAGCREVIGLVVGKRVS